MKRDEVPILIDPTVQKPHLDGAIQESERRGPIPCPADDSNTYSYLKERIPGASALSDAQFREALTFFFGLLPDGRLNIEQIQLAPLLVEDDDFYFHLLGAEVFTNSGLLSDETPPFGLYLANFNQIQPLGNPFVASQYRDRYFEFCDH